MLLGFWVGARRMAGGTQRSSSLGGVVIMKRLDHLRDIDEVTRKALPLPQLLQAVLEQVSNYFKVDTLSMLLVEDDYLRVTAALGAVADEVRQGVRIRLGSGFESKLLASEGPLILDNLE